MKYARLISFAAPLAFLLHMNCFFGLGTDLQPEIAAYCSLFCGAAAGPDTVAPTFTGLTSGQAINISGIRLSWTAASDDASTAAEIVYEICVSTTSGQCRTNFSATHTTSAGAASFDVTSLPADTNHYFVVRARDAVGNTETNTNEVVTSTSAIFFYDMGLVTGALGGRSLADASCQTARNTNFPNLGCTTFHALLSMTASEEIRDLPVPAGIRVMDSTFTHRIGVDWADILDGTIDMSLQAAGIVAGGSMFTGSGTVGNLHAANCTGFTLATGTARSGSTSSTALAWINATPINCGTPNHVVCVCW